MVNEVTLRPLQDHDLWVCDAKRDPKETGPPNMESTA